MMYDNRTVEMCECLFNLMYLITAILIGFGIGFIIGNCAK